ncbi:hypothetical protein FRC03_012593 [Tulasnella sp. 419]|nr:hypothetical protein FRC03_012593 [Tulasnella sp. 419]
MKLKAILLLLASSTVALPSQSPLDGTERGDDLRSDTDASNSIPIIDPREPLLDFEEAEDILDSLYHVPQKTGGNFNRAPLFWDQVEYCELPSGMTGYCIMSDYILQLDGKEVVMKRTNNLLTVKSGVWRSAYEEMYSDQKDKFSIDHVVPLYEAWISGAKDWAILNNPKRTMHYFMNDWDNLITVSREENTSKGLLTPNRRNVKR